MINFKPSPRQRLRRRAAAIMTSDRNELVASAAAMGAFGTCFSHTSTSLCATLYLVYQSAFRFHCSVQNRCLPYQCDPNLGPTLLVHDHQALNFASYAIADEVEGAEGDIQILIHEIQVMVLLVVQVEVKEHTVLVEQVVNLLV